jgi:hypothetical protein
MGQNLFRLLKPVERRGNDEGKNGIMVQAGRVVGGVGFPDFSFGGLCRAGNLQDYA